MSRVDWVTFAIAIGFTPVWLGLEIWRGRKREHLISWVLRRTGWQFSAFVTFWCGLPFHLWAPVPWGATVAGTVVTWSIVAALFVWNVVMWGRVEDVLG